MCIRWTSWRTSPGRPSSMPLTAMTALTAAARGARTARRTADRPLLPVWGGEDAAVDAGGAPPGSGDVDRSAGGSGAVEPGRGGRRSRRSSDELADPGRLRSALEAVLLVVDTPTSSLMLAQVLGRSVPEVEGALRSLRDEYDAGGRGLDLREVADGWRLYSRDEFAPYVERFILDGQQARLTQASLETLAVIAYRQPVTRSRISGIRGVSVDAVMRTSSHQGPRGGVRRGPGHRWRSVPDDSALPREDGSPVLGRTTVSCSTPTRYLAAG